MFDPAQVEARATARAANLRRLRDATCRPQPVYRRLYPRRSRAVTCKPFTPRVRGDRPRRPRREPVRNLNACSTGWPGGANYFPPGAELPKGWVRSSFREGAPPDRRCYPQTGGGDIHTGTGGTLGGSVAAGRSEAARLTEDARREALRTAPRIGGTSVQDQNAFALRYADDVCEPFFCHWDPLDYPTRNAPSVMKGRGRLQEVANLGRVIEPLDITRLRATLGREPTGLETQQACASGQFSIQGRKPRSRSGQWSTSPTVREAARAPGPATSRALTLEPSTVPLPTAPPPVVYATGTFPPGAHVFAGHPRGPWGAPGYYDGPYIPNMEQYWFGRGGGVFATPAQAQAVLGI